MSEGAIIVVTLPVYRIQVGQWLGGVHKLRLQEEGGRWSKHLLFVNFYTIENVNGGGQVVKKS